MAASPEPREGATTSSPPEPDADERAARRTVVLLLLGFIVVLLGAGLLVRAERQHDEGGTDRSADNPAPAPAAGTAALGPASGTAVPAYIASRRAVLTTASGAQVAVVSLQAYVNEPAARALAGKAQVQALLVAAPGGEPSIVTGGLDQWAAAERKSAASERTEIERLLPTVDDPEFAAFYRAEIKRLERVRTGSSPGGPVVYALFLRATADDLRAVAGDGRVRLVDTYPAAEVSPDAVVRGLRPEESVKAGEPAMRP